MDSRLVPELDFWRREIERYPNQDYCEIRKEGFDNLVKQWPEIANLEGAALDLRCGPVSVFEHSATLRMYAVDPLMEEYQKIYTPPEPKVKYLLGHEDDGEIHLYDDELDYVFCINVIDHTPHHRELIHEIKRILKPGGMLYFMVNFDEVLMPPNHVKLWDMRTVECEFVGFFPQIMTVVWNEQYQKYMFWGKFRN